MGPMSENRHSGVKWLNNNTTFDYQWNHKIFLTAIEKIEFLIWLIILYICTKCENKILFDLLKSITNKIIPKWKASLPLHIKWSAPYIWRKVYTLFLTMPCMMPCTYPTWTVIPIQCRMDYVPTISIHFFKIENRIFD